MYGSPVGTKLVTADGELFAAGDTIRVFNMHILSSGGGAAVVTLKNGGSGGTAWVTETGTTSTGKTFDYGVNGILFTNGCYVDVDANTTSVLISCRKDLA